MKTEFQKGLYELVCKIPKGKVTSYKVLAIKLKSSPRAIGRALNANTNLINIPCHRVVHSDFRVGGYKTGTKEKIRLLRKEGVEVKEGKIII